MAVSGFAKYLCVQLVAGAAWYVEEMLKRFTC